jgi:hypothetical protein
LRGITHTVAISLDLGFKLQDPLPAAIGFGCFLGGLSDGFYDASQEICFKVTFFASIATSETSGIAGTARHDV